MKRLTNSIDYCQLNCDFGKEKDCLFQDKSKCYEKNIYEKLREYENLEEQGLLLRLPVKAGDTIWYFDCYYDNYPIEGKVTRIEINENYIIYYSEENCRTIVFDSDDIGKNVFLTQAEAEQKLKEMERE